MILVWSWSNYKKRATRASLQAKPEKAILDSQTFYD